MNLFRNVPLPPLSILTLLLACFGCGHTKPTQVSGDFTLRVTVEHLLDRDAWRATYQTSVPTTNLVFNRRINKFRAKNWKSLTPGISITEEDGLEQISSSDHTPFHEAVFELDSYYQMTPKDYGFFQAFSDDSVVMYTGHFNACPKDLECNRPVEVQLIPRPNEKGIVEGMVFTNALTWKDETTRGTYVYFGNINPVKTKALTAIIDPKLPKWLLQKFTSLLPKLFSHYTKRTGYPLTFKPFIFLNYIPDGEGNSNSGGTLPGLIQLSFKGSGWSKPNNESFINLAKFLAHEAAHLWNGQLFPYASGDMWMHEGGADAFAYLTLYELKFIDQQRFFEFQSEALNHCISSIKNRPLMDVKEDPNFRSHYSCGSMLALLTHAATLKQNHQQDLFTFWNQIFAAVKASGKTYKEELYFLTLDRLAQNNELSKKIEVLLRGPFKSAKEIYLHEFEQLGIKVVQTESHLPLEYHRRMAKDLLALIMKKDCGGKYSVTGGRDGIETEAMDACHVFKSSLYVTHINQIPLISEGAKSYDDVSVTCQSKDSQVTLTVRNRPKPVLLACPDELPTREAYLKIEAVPFRK